jgi:hypothetical protein
LLAALLSRDVTAFHSPLPTRQNAPKSSATGMEANSQVNTKVTMSPSTQDKCSTITKDTKNGPRETYIVPLILSKQNTGFEISGHRGRSIEPIRRKVVASFTSAVHRVRFDCAVQTSNSYLFNFALPNRAQLGDLALPLLRPREAEA